MQSFSDNPAPNNPAPDNPVSSEQYQSAAIAGLERGMHSGANWFYWIAGLSIVNSVLHYLGNDRTFVVGLGITQMIDGIAQGFAANVQEGAGLVARCIAIAMNVLVVLFFWLIGWQANRRQTWAFLLGMFCYAGDGLLFVLFQSWLSVGFHVFALFCIFGGFKSLRQLNAMQYQVDVGAHNAGAGVQEYPGSATPPQNPFGNG